MDFHYPDDGLSGCHPSHPHLHRPSNQTRPTVPSKLTTGLRDIHLCRLAHEINRQRCSLETITCTAVDAGRRSASESVVNPHSSSVYGERQVVVITGDLHGVLPE